MTSVGESRMPILCTSMSTISDTEIGVIFNLRIKLVVVKGNFTQCSWRSSEETVSNAAGGLEIKLRLRSLLVENNCDAADAQKNRTYLYIYKIRYYP